MRFGIIWFIVFFIIVGCGSEKKKEAVLSEEEMIELMVDIHKTDAILMRAVNRGDVKKKEIIQYYKGMLEKHNITREQFDSVFDYYSHDFKKFDEIYSQVIIRLQKQEDSLKHSKQNPINILGKTFIIQSAMNYGKNNGGEWDIAGTNPTMKNGMNLRLWKNDGGEDQQYVVKRGTKNGYYKLSPAHSTNYCVNVGGGTKNGTNVELWVCNDNTDQNFRFVHQGGGRFKIYDFNGKAVCTGRASKNGSNIHIWKDQDGKWMEWYLIDVNTGEPYSP